jgi:type VI secretion system protein ImpL
LSLLLKSIAKETNLSHPPPPANGDKPDQAALRVATLLSAPAGGDRAGPTAQLDQKFRGIQELSTSVNGAPAPIDDLAHNLGSVGQNFNSSAGADGVLGGAGDSSVLRMAADARRLPPPLDGWLGGMAGNLSSITVGKARAQLDTLWASQVRDFCIKSTSNRYPLFKSSTKDMPLGDFAKLFAPGGLMDSFFRTNLKPLVDTSHPQWRWQHIEGTPDLGISPSVLLEFQRAAAIRDTFFQGNGSQPLIHFELTPAELDATATEIQIDIDGQHADYRHGPTRPTPMQWPSPQAGAQTRIAFSSPSKGQTSSTNVGPWALFRLFDGSQIAAGESSDAFRVTFAAGAQHASYDVRTSSVLNPFNLNDLRQFRCPTSF